MVRTLRRFFEKIPTSLLFWSLFAWLVWKLVAIYIVFQAKGDYFYIALSISMLTVGLLIFGSSKLRYKLIIPAVIAAEITIAAIPLL